MRWPLVPTLMAAVMIPVMIGLGIWQLQRAAWKEALLADLAAAATLPPIDLDTAEGNVAISFRRAFAKCTEGPSAPTIVAGRSRNGQTGFSYRVPCRPGLVVDAGWSPRPDAISRTGGAAKVAGIVLDAPIAGAGKATRLLYAERASAPLVPTAPPTIATIPNNHRAYAGQWFGFAATLLVIFVIYVRRTSRS